MKSIHQRIVCFVQYKRECCSSVDFEKFGPEALVDSRVAHRQDNSEVKTGLEETHRGWFNSGVDSLGNWEYICVIPLYLFSGLFCGCCLCFFYHNWRCSNCGFSTLKSLCRFVLIVWLGLFYCIKLIHNHKSTSREFLDFSWLNIFSPKNAAFKLLWSTK